jgi:hypothetical protein
MVSLASSAGSVAPSKLWRNCPDSALFPEFGRLSRSRLANRVCNILCVSPKEGDGASGDEGPAVRGDGGIVLSGALAVSCRARRGRRETAMATAMAMATAPATADTRFSAVLCANILVICT